MEPFNVLARGKKYTTLRLPFSAPSPYFSFLSPVHHCIAFSLSHTHSLFATPPTLLKDNCEESTRAQGKNRHTCCFAISFPSLSENLSNANHAPHVVHLHSFIPPFLVSLSLSLSLSPPPPLAHSLAFRPAWLPAQNSLPRRR